MYVDTVAFEVPCAWVVSSLSYVEELLGPGVLGVCVFTTSCFGQDIIQKYLFTQCQKFLCNSNSSIINFWWNGEESIPFARFYIFLEHCICPTSGIRRFPVHRTFMRVWRDCISRILALYHISGLVVWLTVPCAWELWAVPPTHYSLIWTMP